MRFLAPASAARQGADAFQRSPASKQREAEREAGGGAHRTRRQRSSRWPSWRMTWRWQSPADQCLQGSRRKRTVWPLYISTHTDTYSLLADRERETTQRAQYYIYYILYIVQVQLKPQSQLGRVYRSLCHNSKSVDLSVSVSTDSACQPSCVWLSFPSQRTAFDSATDRWACRRTRRSSVGR